MNTGGPESGAVQSDVRDASAVALLVAVVTLLLLWRGVEKGWLTILG